MTRSGAAAIAAVLALSSTQAFAQDAAVDPAVSAEETPVTSGTPAEAPAPTDELAPLAEPEPALDATASGASEPAPAPAARTTRKPAQASAPRPARSDASPTSQAPVAEAPMAEPATVAAEAMTMPVTPMEPTEAQAAPLGPVNEEVGYGLGAAALLALGVGAFAVTRRRRVDEGEEEPVQFEEEAVAPVPSRPEPARYDPPIFAPAMAGYAGHRSAFAWGGAAPDMAAARTRETHVERAMRGPTPDNPSLSIRKRLKRAAFFDKREREMAQGKGQPVDRFAGLPEAVAAPAPAPAAWATRAPQRELEPA